MSTPVDPAAADQAARDQLAEQAGTVLGNPAAAGIFGDVAGAAQPPQPLDVSTATASAADPAELMKMLQQQQAQINALLAQQAADKAAAEPAPAEPMNVSPRLANASGELQEAFNWLHKRVAAIEQHLSLSAIEAVLREL